ncbi:hypothetical protein CGZ93_00585 [Enemella dayhoffiae]|uniref:Glycosyl transferase family 28 C-terminal domain-containing protein n=1 Tax=Enemella dayhoffiae TaxID=2016507 RepID=A0A255HBI9_9ACTN|nr:hypothetical protein [Enemella dayhoffiae]OYO25350.1 hypothetical protein CGZ93_00585 [Enemella dayhoffiae]
MTIGWYVHHQGSGHLTRAGVIAAHLDEPVTVLTSRERPEGPLGFADWVRLSPDWDGSDVPQDPTAGGALHWVPRRHPGLRARMTQLSAWIDEVRPSAMVVDVSVEVATLARLHGVPVVVAVLPGERTDRAHRLAHRLADALLAPWPRRWYAAEQVAGHDDRLHCVGGLSRFTGRERVAEPEPGRVLLLAGSGGTDGDDAGQPWRRDRAGEWHWRVLGGPGGRWLADPWEELCRAEVVVCQPGQNAVADAGAAGARVIAVPQRRPFGEQYATTEALVRAELALGVPGWPAPADWPELLERARALQPDWSRWELAGAAERAAGVVRAVADA